jgi:hypothetical protein
VRSGGSPLRMNWLTRLAVVQEGTTNDSRRGWLTAKKYEGRTTSVDVDYLYDDIGHRK